MKYRSSWRLCDVVLLLILSAGIAPAAPSVPKPPRRRPAPPEPVTRPAAATRPVTLFNGWKLSPAGVHLKIENMPLKMVISPDGKTLAAVCGGISPGVALIDLQTRTLRQWVKLARSWNGIAYSKDGKNLFVTGGASDRLLRFDVNNGKVGDPTRAFLASAKEDLGAIPPEHFLAGLAIHPQTGKLYICNEGTHELWVVDPKTLKREAAVPVGEHPHSVVVGGNPRYVYVSNWGARSVSVIDTKYSRRVLDISVGIRPNDMALAPDGRLFVCCAGDNTVHVIPTTVLTREEQPDESAPPPERGQEIISTSLYPSSPEGSTPNAACISPDGKTLYVANADNNDVAVIDISNPKVSLVKGFVPVGWYPTAVACDGRQLFVAEGKGLSSRPSVPSWGVSPRVVGGTRYDHPTGIIEGWVSFIDRPDDAQLATFTAQVRRNSPYTPECFKQTATKSEGIIPDQVGQPCPIKHVLYIIKENRTYDQVMGDMTDHNGKHIGNGDPKLTLFGNDITPNQHELARQYVLLDNLYCNSEVSADGHSWCDGAIATDYRQKGWVVRYTRHGELPGNAEMNNPAGGYLWDLCREHGVSFKCYGEGASRVPVTNRGTWGGGRDMDRVDFWIKDLHEAEKTGNLPQFMVMSLGENHTRGTRPGSFTPQSMVASNDIGVAKIVAAASRSKFWNQMAIFIIEDDAQNGPDHVDAHRTAGLVISPYVKRGIVDSTPYTTTSMIRTMELILGLPPMTQYDGGATPMFNCFMKSPQPSVYEVIQPRTDLAAKNTPQSPGAAASARMDFDEWDEAPEDELNRILWAAVKGTDAPYPTPIHRAVFMKSNESDGGE
jgi:YVTN family beta-propeller protein